MSKKNTVSKNNVWKRVIPNKNKHESNVTKATLNLVGINDENLEKEIIDTLTVCPFSKISMPLSTYRQYIGSADSSEDARISTVGYIKSYDAETRTFELIIFKTHKEDVDRFDRPMVTPIFTTNRDGSLRVITKLVVEPGYSDDELRAQAENSEDDVDEVEDPDDIDRVADPDDEDEVEDSGNTVDPRSLYSADDIGPSNIPPTEVTEEVTDVVES